MTRALRATTAASAGVLWLLLGACGGTGHAVPPTAATAPPASPPSAPAAVSATTPQLRLSGKGVALPAGDGRYCQVTDDNFQPEPYPTYFELFDAGGVLLRRQQIGTATLQTGWRLGACSASTNLFVVFKTCVSSTCEASAYRLSDIARLFDRTYPGPDGWGASGATVSPTGRYVTESSSEGCRIVDVTTGQVVGSSAGSQCPPFPAG